MKCTEQCPVREDNLCAVKRTAQVGTIHHSASDTEIADSWPTSVFNPHGRQFHELKTQLQLSASYFEGALHGFLCFAPEPPAKLWELELVWLFQSHSEELGNQ